MDLHILDHIGIYALHIILYNIYIYTYIGPAVQVSTFHPQTKTNSEHEFPTEDEFSRR